MGVAGAVLGASLGKRRACLTAVTFEPSRFLIRLLRLRPKIHVEQSPVAGRVLQEAAFGGSVTHESGIRVEGLEKPVCRWLLWVLEMTGSSWGDSPENERETC